MPGPLPRYDELGIRIAPVQPISAVGAQAAAQVGQTLVENMNRLTTFAFREAEETARAQGLEYGAANAPTPDQLRRAVETGEQVMPGDLTTTFGRASRSSALTIATQAMQTEALSKMTAARAEALAGDIPAEKFSGNLQNIIDGYSSSLAKASPASAAQLRASLATTANSAYITYLEKQIAKDEARKKIQVQDGADQLIQYVPDVIAAGDTVEPKTGTVTTLDQKIAIMRVQIIQAGVSTNDPAFVKEKLKQLNDAVTKAKVATVAGWTVDPSTGVPSADRYVQVMTGTIGMAPEMANEAQLVRAGKVASMWGSMSIEERVQAQDEVRRQMKGQLELDSALNVTATKKRSEDTARARIDFRQAWGKSDASGMDEALQRMDKLGDSEGYEKHATIAAEKRSHTESGILMQLERETVRGTLTEDRIFDLVQQRRLADDDARGYIGKLDTVRERNFQNAIKMVKGELGYPDTSIIRMGTTEDRKAEQQVAAIQNSLIEKKRINPDIDVYAEAQKLVKEVKAKDASAADQASWRSMVAQNAKYLGLPDGAPLDQVRQALAADELRGAKAKIGRPETRTQIRRALDELEKLGPTK
jgi:hypothetical protein